MLEIFSQVYVVRYLSKEDENEQDQIKQDISPYSQTTYIWNYYWYKFSILGRKQLSQFSQI